MWKAKTAKLRKLYAVVRKRAVHKNTLQSFATAFTRYVIFVMTLEVYNEVHGNLANLKEYKLSSNMMITHYYFDTGHAVRIVPTKHGNAKSLDTPDFRPTEHSLKKECKQTVQVSNKAPRILAESLGQTGETILGSTTDSTRLRNPKQASNYKFNYGSVSRSDQDEISNVILALLEQNHGSDSVVLDDNQPFIREVIFRNGRQPSIVAFTDQTIKDVSRFCTRSGSLTHFSPLLIDTTFNIAEYYFTQTAYENLSLPKKDTGKHPWFPGPVLVHRNKTTEVFKYLWQSVKRENYQLEGLHVLGSDEDEALFTGILQETAGTIHLLGLEHVQANVEKKLTECNFPVQEKKSLWPIFLEGGQWEKMAACMTAKVKKNSTRNAKRLKRNGMNWRSRQRRTTHLNSQSTLPNTR